MTGSQPSHRTPSGRDEIVTDPSTINEYDDDDDDDDEIDVESLRRVFGSFSPEDLKKRKPHELREQWMEAMQEQESISTSTATSNTEDVKSSTKAKAKTKTRLPRFLLDPKHEHHVAPHAFALQLLLGHTHPGYRLRRSRSKSRADGDGIYRKVATINNSIDEDNDNDDNYNYNDNESSRVSHRRRRRRRVSRQQERDLPGPLAALLLASIASASLACQFVLEVLGGAGAIWGCAELVGWRTGGLGQPSGDRTQTIALGVGMVCFLRFVVTRFCGSASGSGSSPSVRDRCRRILLRNGNSTGWASMVLELSRIAAEDPVGFLHPSRGPVIASLCGECSGGNDDGDNYEDDDDDDDDYGEDDYGDEELGRPRRRKSLAPSPPSLGGERRRGNSTPSPQRKTWEMSSDDDVDDEVEVDRAHGWSH